MGRRRSIEWLREAALPGAGVGKAAVAGGARVGGRRHVVVEQEETSKQVASKSFVRKYNQHKRRAGSNTQHTRTGTRTRSLSRGCRYVHTRERSPSQTGRRLPTSCACVDSAAAPPFHSKGYTARPPAHLPPYRHIHLVNNARLSTKRVTPRGSLSRILVAAVRITKKIPKST